MVLIPCASPVIIEILYIFSGMLLQNTDVLQNDPDLIERFEKIVLLSDSNQGRNN